MSEKTKRVRMLSPVPIFDGLGGQHKKGEMPELPAEIAEAFVAKGLAVWTSATVEDAEDAARNADPRTRTEQQAIAEDAAARMASHDALPPDARASAYDRQYDRKPVDETDAKLLALNKEIDECLSESSTTTSGPAKSPGMKTPKTAASGSPRKRLTSPPSSTTTPGSAEGADVTTGKETSD